jgi:hypothetical protein
MFVRYFVELPLPAAQVERALVDHPPGWLAEMAGAAQQRGDELLTEVGVGPLGTRLGRRVAIQLGEPMRFPSMTSLTLTWEPIGLEGLLPRLDADIELGSLGEDRTQLADGRTNGQIAADLGLAEKTVKNYVSSILAKLEVARRAEAAAYLARHTTHQDG